MCSDNDAVTVFTHLVYFGGPIVQHSCAMNTHACSMHFVIACLCQRRGGTLYNHELLSVCQKRVEIWLYSCTVGWTQVKHSYGCAIGFSIAFMLRNEILLQACVVKTVHRCVISMNSVHTLQESRSYHDIYNHTYKKKKIYIHVCVCMCVCVCVYRTL